MILNILAIAKFMPHGSCYLWQSNLIWLHALSDGFVAIAYYSIPISLAYFALRRQDLPFPRIFWLFAIFIIFCGTTHWLEIWTLWYPNYWLSGIVKALTALISIYTTLEIIPLVPQALALPSPSELKAINQKLQQEIAKNKQTARALRESEKRFRSAFKYAAIGMALVAPDGKWLQVNSSLCEIVGYSETELLDLTFQDITYAEDLESDLQFVRQMLAGKIRTYQMEKRYIHKLGHLVWVLLSVSLVKDENRQPRYFISQIKDITVRKEAEAQLRLSEERYRSVVEDQTELIVRYERDGVITFVNQAYCSFFQQKKEAILGKVALSIAISEDEPKIERLLESLNPKNSVEQVEFRTVVDDKIHWMQWVYRAIFNERDELVELQSVGRDISDLVKTQEALKQNEELFRITLKNSPINVCTQDTELRYTWIYNSFARYPIERLIGKLEAEVFSAENARALATVKKKVLNSGIGAREVVLLVVNGRTLYYDLTVEPLWDREQTLVGIACVALDISNRKQAEQTVRYYDSIVRSLYNSKAFATGVVELVDNDLVHISGNTTAVDFFGLELENFIGSSFRKTIAYVEIVERWLDSCHQCQLENEPVYFEYIHAGEDDAKYVAVNISPICYSERMDNKSLKSKRMRFSYAVEDISERKLAAIFKQKQLRIQEMHHRVKNNLQIICSLLNLQTRAIEEPATIAYLQELKQRIQSIALIHEKLYQSENVSHLNLSEYIEDLVNSIFRSYLFREKNVNLTTEIIQNFWLDLDTAVPCGLLIDELITNALKHAFEPGTEGAIKVRVEADKANNLVLTIADNGKGLVSNLDLNNSKTLGLKIVKNLTAQLRGTIEVNIDRGTEYKITLPNTKKLVYSQSTQQLLTKMR